MTDRMIALDALVLSVAQATAEWVADKMRDEVIAPEMVWACRKNIAAEILRLTIESAAEDPDSEYRALKRALTQQDGAA